MPRVVPTEFAGIPVWLILFIVAGFLLFLFKIAGNPQNLPQNGEELSRLQVFFLIATLLFAVAGIADFVVWAKPW
jgi:tryptophan-rich sensory protein